MSLAAAWAACGALTTLRVVPRELTLAYAWSAALSNVDTHPQAPLFSAGPGYPTPLLEVTFPDLPRALPYRFIVDTGSPVTAISAELAQALALGPLHSAGVRLEDEPVEWARIGRMVMGDLELRQVPVVVLDALAPAGATESQVLVDGLLGMNVLSAFAWELRPESGRFAAHPTGHPLAGIPVALGAAVDQLVVAGGVGVAAEPPRERRAASEGADEDLSWAPILIPTSPLRDPPPAALAPPEAERDPRLPSGGPHLLQLATGLSSTRVHPDLLPWAGGTGEVATEALPLQVSLLEHLTAEILDERPPADVLREVTRYTLPALSVGDVTLTDLPLYHRDEPWEHAPLAAILGADVLGAVSMGFDVTQGVLTLDVPVPAESAPSIQPHLLTWAEALLSLPDGEYLAQEEAMHRLLFAGRWPEAAQLAARLIQRNPSAVAAWMLLARQAERRGEMDEGLQFYRRLYWVRSGRVPAMLGAARLELLGGDLAAAMQDLSSVDEASGADRARVWRARAQIHLARSQQDQALRAFRIALDGVVDDAGARRGLAWLAFRDGRLEEAEAHLIACLNLTPDDPFAQELMLATLRALGREADIDPWVEMLGRHFPYPAPDGRDPIAPLRVRLARERGNLDRMEAILAEQDRAQQRAALASPAPRVRARALEMRAALYLAARQRLDQALELAGEANAVDPSQRAGLYIGAEILRALGDDGAPAAYQRAWRAAPFDLALYLATQGWHVPDLAPPPPAPLKKAPPPARIQRTLPDRKR